MTTINPYLESMQSRSDDELFEIIMNQKRDESPLLFDAAVITAHSRELLTDFQTQELMAGNKQVLEYNPNVIEEIPENPKPYKPKLSNPYNFSGYKILYGLGSMAIGALIIYLAYIEFFYTNSTKYFGGGLLVILGFVLVIIGFMENSSKR